MTSVNSKIVKNTLFLYVRMIFIMLVSLFTVRIIISVLGIQDYGINNVVGGIVVMFAFLSNSMAAASQRFFAFEIGRKDYIKLRNTFSMTLINYFLLSIIIVVLAETIGLWFVKSELTIPPERMQAAIWVFHFSIASFILTILTIPYNALIIAHEEMRIYAYVSVFEVILKLVLVYSLYYFQYDKLKLYSTLIFIVTALNTLIYTSICRKKYSESRFQIYWNKDLFKTLVGYSSWNLFGATATILNSQGINILLNIFFGPIVNASRGISYQISTSINQFVMNFLKAVQPQITKSFASNKMKEMLLLVIRSSKISFFLLLVLSMPVLIKTDTIINLWLGKVPDFVVIFTRLVVINALIDSISYPLQTAAQATGKIRNYQIFVGGMMLMNIPISYLFLKLGYPPQVTMFVAITISVFCLILRLFFLKHMVNFDVYYFFREVILRIIYSTLFSFTIPFIFCIVMSNSIISLILITIISFFSSIIFSYYIGLTKTERQYMYLLVVNRFIKKDKRLV